MYPEYEKSLKAITILLGMMAINLDFIVSLVSWLVIHPLMWQSYGWESPQKVYMQFYVMGLHTVPIICASINFIFLTDAPIYISDALIIAVVGIFYVIFNYFVYAVTGSIYYPFLDWSDPH